MSEPTDAPDSLTVPTILTAAGPLPAPGRVLVVSAHPDDVDFSAAGTVAALTEAGSHVSYCMCTSGDSGSDHLPLEAEELARLREVEQTAAAAVVGVTDLHWLRHGDGRLQPTLDLRRDISAVIRKVRPDVVIAQSPDRNYERMYASHPDHLAAGEATMCAVYPDARNPRAFPELIDQGLAPHAVGQVWMVAFTGANLFVDVGATFERKMAALRAHESQTGGMEGIDDMLRGFLGANAVLGDMTEGSLAESFRIIVTT